MNDRLEELGRLDAWDGTAVVVAGLGASGMAAVDNLTFLGASVTGLDEAPPGDRGERAALLEDLGATLRFGPGSTGVLPGDVDLVIASPGWEADAPLLAQAADRGVPVWSEVELAWRLRDPERPAPWLVVTGSRSPASAVRLLELMLRGAGRRTVVCGTGEVPLVEAVMTGPVGGPVSGPVVAHGEEGAAYDVLAVALSADQLPRTRSMSAHAAAVLDATGDRRVDLGRVYENVRQACVYNVADPATEQLVRDADVVEGARAIGFTLGTPAVGMLGLVEDVLVDRAFIENRYEAAAELGTLADLGEPDPVVVQDALAAAALARSLGVPPVAVRDALRAFTP